MHEVSQDATPTNVILHLLIASTYFCKMFTSRKGRGMDDSLDQENFLKISKIIS